LSKKIAKPISVIPFKLNNMADFVPDQAYPNLHPQSKAYNTYWDQKTEDCLYGIWGDDSRMEGAHKVGGQRWLPGNMAFYTHHTIIKKEIPGQDAKGDAPPDMRDVEWLLGYDNITCDGFGGFEYDNKFTCFRPIGKMEAGIDLTNSEKKLIERHSDFIRDKYGNFKKYKEAREYLYETRPEPLGKPLWLNEKKNNMLLSTRRLGKSYFVINGIVLYKFTFNGAKTLEEFYQQKTSITCVIGSGNSDKTKEFFEKFNTAYDYLRDSVGSYRDGKRIDSGYWWWKIEGSTKKENSFITNAVKAEGRGAGLVGPGSRLWHVSYANSASKGAGTSLDEAIIEEVGLTPDVEDIHAENTPAQKSDYKFGKSTYIGTGGDFDTIEGSKKLFYYPDTFDILACKNIFVKGGKDTARFVPATYYENQFRDENGNQDIQLAFEDIMAERDKKEALDTMQYLRHKASYPLTPDEIFVKYDGNSFPVKNLEKRKAFLKDGGVPFSIGKIAFFDKQNTDAYWLEDFDSRPLLEMEDLSADNMNKEGAMIQYEEPNEDRPKRKYNDRNPMYLTFVEPVRNDKGTSYMYSYVWKFFDWANPDRIQDNIVFEWFGRIDNDNDKNLARAFAIAAYYDSNIYAETNNDRIKGYARSIKKYEWLQPWLGHLPGLETSTNKEQDVGVYILPGQNISLEKLTNEWLRKVVRFNERIDGSEFTREEEIMADTLNSQMLCSQLISYHREDNFDAYDGIRLKAIWDKANEGIDAQFIDNDKEKKILTIMKQIQATRNMSARRRMSSLKR